MVDKAFVIRMNAEVTISLDPVITTSDKDVRDIEEVSNGFNAFYQYNTQLHHYDLELQRLLIRKWEEIDPLYVLHEALLWTRSV